jgi:hypothetical protein
VRGCVRADGCCRQQWAWEGGKVTESLDKVLCGILEQSYGRLAQLPY